MSCVSNKITNSHKPIKGLKCRILPHQTLKAHNVLPKVTSPPWLHPVNIWFQAVWATLQSGVPPVEDPGYD